MGGWDDFTSGLRDIGGMAGSVFDKVASGPMHIFDTGAGVVTHTEDKLSDTITGVSSNLSMPLIIGGIVVLVIMMKK